MLVRLSGFSRVGKACGSPPSGSASSYDGQRTTITTPAATSGFHTVLLMAVRRQNVSDSTMILRQNRIPRKNAISFDYRGSHPARSGWRVAWRKAKGCSILSNPFRKSVGERSWLLLSCLAFSWLLLLLLLLLFVLLPLPSRNVVRLDY